MIKVAPSILSADFTNLKEDVLNVIKAGADIIHLDIMDGHFVPNLTFGIPIISAIRSFTDMPIDAHFMVTNPEDYLSLISKYHINFFSFHLETVFHAHRLIQYIKKEGSKAGIAINPSTPICLLEELIKFLDFVLIMSVNPGFGGQKFISTTYEKVKKLKDLSKRLNPKLLIEVDGGINQENAKKLENLGVNILVAGSYIFKSRNYSEAINKLKGYKNV